MRKIFCFILVIVPLLTLSQNNNSSITHIEISEPYKVVDGKRKIYFQKNNTLFSVKISGETVSLQTTNTTTLKLNYTKKEDLPNGAVVESILKLGDKYYLFYSLWDKSSKNEQLFYSEIDFEKGMLKEAIKVISVNHHLCRISMDEIIGFWGHNVTSKFHFKISDDKSKLLILYRHLRDKRRDAVNYDIVGITVFNTDVDLLWSKEIKMPYSEKKMNFLDNAIDKNGNAYLLVSLFNDNTTRIIRKDGTLNQRAEILKYENNSGKLMETIPVGLKDHLINKFGFYKISNNTIHLHGFFGDDIYSSQCNGLFDLLINQKNKSAEEHIYECTDDIVNKTNSDSVYEWSDYKVVERTDSKNKSSLIISEQQLIEVITTYSRTGKHENYHYYYNDIILTKLDSSGSVVWMRKLPKEQFGYKGVGTMSYKFLETNNYYYILFFDDVDNKNIINEYKLATYTDSKNAVLCAFQVSKENGNTKKITILDTQDTNGLTLKQFNINRLVPIGNNSFVLEAYKKKKEDVLIKVHLKE